MLPAHCPITSVPVPCTVTTNFTPTSTPFVACNLARGRVFRTKTRLPMGSLSTGETEIHRKLRDTRRGENIRPSGYIRRCEFRITTERTLLLLFKQDDYCNSSACSGYYCYCRGSWTLHGRLCWLPIQVRYFGFHFSLITILHQSFSGLPNSTNTCWAHSESTATRARLVEEQTRTRRYCSTNICAQLTYKSSLNVYW